MKHITPEQAGLSSKDVERFIRFLEEKQLSTHNVILARGEQIFFEAYWEPFHEDFGHRMYSVSKSIVSLAIGFCEQEGLVCLEDPICKYFPKEAAYATDENLKNQTVRDMLMMATAKPCMDWFAARPDDRVKFYFQNNRDSSRPGGTIFDYDSTGSFVLGALVERVTGMELMAYLRPRLFDKIGVSKEAYCLKCPGGHAWGDSGIVMKPSDLLKIARFLLNRGKWNGEQILNEQYVTAATSKQIDNNPAGLNEFDTQGYGYQIWRTYRNSFSLNGMGCQYAICVPDLDLILIYNGDNQGKAFAKPEIFEGFFRFIADEMQEGPIAEDAGAYQSLKDFCSGRKLAAAKGQDYSAFQKEINGRIFELKDNPMGIKQFTLTFDGRGGYFSYINEQGSKKLPFQMCENAFADFPQEGYSDQVGSESTKGYYYPCAVSAAWVEERKLFLKVQAIGTYFGTLDMTFGFTKDGRVGLFMTKCAEDFFNEYVGYADGIIL